MALDNLLNIFDKKFKKNISEEFPKLNAQIVVLGLARIFWILLMHLSNNMVI